MLALVECKTHFAKRSELDIKKTLECGQCFRWSTDKNGVYVLIAREKVLHICEHGNNIMCDCDDKDLVFWKNYFDMHGDYLSAKNRMIEPEYLRVCADYGSGIHILRQEPWEALCSFIISQCNNIPRIQKIIETLCSTFGEIIPGGYFSFPSAERLAPLNESDLTPLRSGYRASYILDAARAVSENRINFTELMTTPSEEIFLTIKQINGVGDKVANCFMLYGMHRMDRFPIDTWMKRALKKHFPPDYDPSILGEDSGLAQQYIFYYTRTRARELALKTENC